MAWRRIGLMNVEETKSTAFLSAVRGITWNERSVKLSVDRLHHGSPFRNALKLVAVIKQVAVQAAHEVLPRVLADIRRERQRLEHVVCVLVQLERALVLKLVQDHVAHLFDAARCVDQVELEAVLEAKHRVVVLFEDGIALANQLRVANVGDKENRKKSVS